MRAEIIWVIVEKLVPRKAKLVHPDAGGSKEAQEMVGMGWQGLHKSGRASCMRSHCMGFVAWCGVLLSVGTEFNDILTS